MHALTLCGHHAPVVAESEYKLDSVSYVNL